MSSILSDLLTIYSLKELHVKAKHLSFIHNFALPPDPTWLFTTTEQPIDLASNPYLDYSISTKLMLIITIINIVTVLESVVVLTLADTTDRLIIGLGFIVAPGCRWTTVLSMT